MADLFTLTNITETLFPHVSSSSENYLFSEARLKQGVIDLYDLITKNNGPWLAIVRYVADDRADAENCTGFGHTSKQHLYWTLTAYLGKFQLDSISANEDASALVLSAKNLHSYHWDSNTEKKSWLSVPENSFTLPKTSFNYVQTVPPIHFPHYLRFGAGINLEYAGGAIPQIAGDKLPTMALEKIPEWLCVVPQNNFRLLDLFGGIPSIESIVGELPKSDKN